jgi:alanyl-tRNA synthetase
MAALLRATLSKIAGRGGGSKDLAQGGAPSSAGLTEAVESAAQSIVQ